VDDLRRAVRELTGRGVRVQFVKELLTFTGEDNATSALLLNMFGAVAEFERSLIRERQREGIAIAKRAGVYKGRRPSLAPGAIAELRKRVAAGERKSALAVKYGVTRQTVTTLWDSRKPSIYRGWLTA
jgi:DNA invertase Pin-like site-specific DNA recombinase